MKVRACNLNVLILSQESDNMKIYFLYKGRRGEYIDLSLAITVPKYSFYYICLTF